MAYGDELEPVLPPFSLRSATSSCRILASDPDAQSMYQFVGVIEYLPNISRNGIVARVCHNWLVVSNDSIPVVQSCMRTTS